MKYEISEEQILGLIEALESRDPLRIYVATSFLKFLLSES